MNFHTTLKKILLQHGYLLLLIVLVLGSFVLRIALHSQYLDDWDSIQFVLALKEYSIPAHQPHPPGYPIYVLLGKIANAVIRNGQHSFIVISATFGSLSLIPTYYLGKYLFNEKIGILAAFILSLTPAALLFSEVVMSDIVSMFFIVLTLCLLYVGIENDICLYIGSFILGITIGVRQTDFLLLPLFFYILYSKGNIKKSILSSFISIFAILIWLVPVLIITGPEAFLNAQRSQGNVVFGYGIWNTLSWPILLNFLHSILRLLILLIKGWSLSLFLFVAVTIIIVVYPYLKNYRFDLDKRKLFFVLWILPYLAYFILFGQLLLYIPRYLLPIFPAFALIFSYSLVKAINISNKKIMKTFLIVIFAISIGFMGYQAVSTVYRLHTTMPAPVQAANFIKEHYNPENTVIIGDYESFRHYYYYLSEYDVRYIGVMNTTEAYYLLLENKTVVSGIDLGPSPKEIHLFSRDPKIYPKHHDVRLFIFQLAENRENFYFGNGWYTREMRDAIPFNWIGTNASLYIYSEENREVDLNFQAISAIRPKVLDVYEGTHPIATFTISHEQLTDVRLPLTLSKGTTIVFFSLPEGCERPSDFQEVKNPDSRCLGIAIQNITFI